MQTYQPTTPFGRRALALGQIATQAVAKTRAPEKAAHKWNVFRDICAAKARLSVSDRALAVLNALLSFHQETVLAGSGLIVFPSNRQLSIRANGMAPATLRRHLAALVDAGLVIRRDSPNGKRYARKGRDGEIETAFGFDLSPMVARAEEYAQLAEAIRREERAARLLRERISICRRDIVKMIALGMECGAASPCDSETAHSAYRGLIARLSTATALGQLAVLAEEFELLATEILNRLENQANPQNLSANESQIDRHIQTSNTNSQIDIEPSNKQERASRAASNAPRQDRPQIFPLETVLRACPEVANYARNGVATWGDLLSAVNLVVRPSLGISPSAWEGAREVMGEIPAAITVAAILQRAESISSAGGYLRDLTRRAGEGKFTIGPMLMALLKSPGGVRAPQPS